jgi:hypothetical protein
MKDNNSKYAPDRFGLPVPPPGKESAKERLWRKAVARREGELLLAGAYIRLKEILGEAESRREMNFGATSLAAPPGGIIERVEILAHRWARCRECLPVCVIRTCR